MPSFNRLIEIKHSIDSRVEKNESIEFSYSATIRKLPEGQRKLYMTITDYIAAYANNTDGKRPAADIRKLSVLQGAEDISDFKPEQIIYSTPAITILEPNM